MLKWIQRINAIFCFMAVSDIYNLSIFASCYYFSPNCRNTCRFRLLLNSTRRQIPLLVLPNSRFRFSEFSTSSSLKVFSYSNLGDRDKKQNHSGIDIKQSTKNLASSYYSSSSASSSSSTSTLTSMESVVDRLRTVIRESLSNEGLQNVETCGPKKNRAKDSKETQVNFTPNPNLNGDLKSNEDQDELELELSNLIINDRINLIPLRRTLDDIDLFLENNSINGNPVKSRTSTNNASSSSSAVDASDINDNEKNKDDDKALYKSSTFVDYIERRFNPNHLKRVQQESYVNRIAFIYCRHRIPDFDSRVKSLLSFIPSLSTNPSILHQERGIYTSSDSESKNIYRFLLKTQANTASLVDKKSKEIENPKIKEASKAKIWEYIEQLKRKQQVVATAIPLMESIHNEMFDIRDRRLLENSKIDWNYNADEKVVEKTISGEEVEELSMDAIENLCLKTLKNMNMNIQIPHYLSSSSSSDTVNETEIVCLRNVNMNISKKNRRLHFLKRNREEYLYTEYPKEEFDGLVCLIDRSDPKSTVLHVLLAVECKRSCDAVVDDLFKYHMLVDILCDKKDNNNPQLNQIEKVSLPYETQSKIITVVENHNKNVLANEREENKGRILDIRQLSEGDFSKEVTFDFNGFDKYQHCVYLVKYGSCINLVRKVLLELIQLPDDEETVLKYYNSYIDIDMNKISNSSKNANTSRSDFQLLQDRRSVIQQLCDNFKSMHREMALKRIQLLQRNLGTRDSALPWPVYKLLEG